MTNYWQTGCTINALYISYNRGKRDLPDIYALAQGSHEVYEIAQTFSILIMKCGKINNKGKFQPSKVTMAIP